MPAALLGGEERRGKAVEGTQGGSSAESLDDCPTDALARDLRDRGCRDEREVVFEFEPEGRGVLGFELRLVLPCLYLDRADNLPVLSPSFQVKPHKGHDEVDRKGEDGERDRQADKVAEETRRRHPRALSRAARESSFALPEGEPGLAVRSDLPRLQRPSPRGRRG